jgi:hypothetical protein
MVAGSGKLASGLIAAGGRSGVPLLGLSAAAGAVVGWLSRASHVWALATSKLQKNAAPATMQRSFFMGHLPVLFRLPLGVTLPAGFGGLFPHAGQFGFLFIFEPCLLLPQIGFLLLLARFLVLLTGLLNHHAASRVGPAPR